MIRKTRSPTKLTKKRLPEWRTSRVIKKSNEDFKSQILNVWLDLTKAIIEDGGNKDWFYIILERL